MSGDDIRGGELGCCCGTGGSTAGVDTGVPVRVRDRCEAELTGGAKATGGTGVTTPWACGCC
jgi:hypothetical protein